MKQRYVCLVIIDRVRSGSCCLQIAYDSQIEHLPSALIRLNYQAGNRVDIVSVVGDPRFSEATTACVNRRSPGACDDEFFRTTVRCTNVVSSGSMLLITWDTSTTSTVSRKLGPEFPSSYFSSSDIFA